MTGSRTFISRCFCSVQALHEPVVNGGLGTLSDIDRVRDVIEIYLTDPHRLGEARAAVRKLLGRFKLTHDAVVTVA